MQFFLPLALILSGALAGPVERRQLSGSLCDKSCPHGHDPVCGSDGKTYNNLCYLAVAACYYHEKGTTLTIRSRGQCGGNHHNHQNHASQSNCDLICDEEKHHICASDGKVYDNACLFKRARCEAAKTNTHIFAVVYADTCPTPTVPDCSKYQIDTNDIAVEGGVTITPTCPHTRANVCASDGQSYSSECQLCHHMEVKNVSLTITHSGACHHLSLQ